MRVCFLFVILLLGGCSSKRPLSESNECVKIKAAFDLGSGSTKMKVGRVNVCRQKIEKILLEASLPVKYKESLQNSRDNWLDREIQNKGVEAVLKLKEMAQAFGPSSYQGVATSAFRTATNGKDFAAKLAQDTGVKISVISQEEEAKLGFVAASAIASGDLKEILVWDIGGGSMQMVSYSGNGEFVIYQGKLASASFKKEIIANVQGRNPLLVETPNPIGYANSQKAVALARKRAFQTVPPAIKEKLANDPEVIGIGGVHYFSVRKRVSKDDLVTLREIKQAAKTAVSLTDTQAGGDYASTDISNLLLVQGFMEALGIEKVKTGRINLADGILLSGSKLF